MATVDSEVLIKILTEFEENGAQAAIDKLKALEGAALSAEQSASPLGKAFGDAADGIGGIADDGGNAAEALGEIARETQAFQAAAGALKIERFSIIATAIVTALGMIWDAYQSHRAAAAKADEEARKEAEQAAKEAQRHLEDLDKAKMEGARAAASDLKEQLKGAADEADRARKNMDELEEAELQEKLSEIDLAKEQGKISADDARFQRAEARYGFRKGKAARKAEAENAEEARLEAAAEETAADLTRALAEYRNAEEELAAATEAVAAAEKSLAEANDTLKAAQVQARANWDHGMPTVSVELAEAQKQAKAAEEAVAAAKAQQADAKAKEEDYAVALAAAEGAAGAASKAALEGRERISQSRAVAPHLDAVVENEFAIAQEQHAKAEAKAAEAQRKAAEQAAKDAEDAAKPVPLLEMLARTYTDEGETILDPTMGSGSMGVACAHAGRKFIGIEKDAHYYAVARSRLPPPPPTDASGNADRRFLQPLATPLQGVFLFRGNPSFLKSWIIFSLSAAKYTGDGSPHLLHLPNIGTPRRLKPPLVPCPAFAGQGSKFASAFRPSDSGFHSFCGKMEKSRGKMPRVLNSSLFSFHSFLRSAAPGRATPPGSTRGRGSAGVPDPRGSTSSGVSHPASLPPARRR